MLLKIKWVRIITSVRPRHDERNARAFVPLHPTASCMRCPSPPKKSCHHSEFSLNGSPHQDLIKGPKGDPRKGFFFTLLIAVFLETRLLCILTRSNVCKPMRVSPSVQVNFSHYALFFCLLALSTKPTLSRVARYFDRTPIRHQTSLI